MNSLDYVKDYYGLPFIKRGMKVSVNGKTGVITSGSNHIHVRFEGQTHASHCHPTWKVIYYGKDGEILKDFSSVE